MPICSKQAHMPTSVTLSVIGWQRKGNIPQKDVVSFPFQFLWCPDFEQPVPVYNICISI